MNIDERSKQIVTEIRKHADGPPEAVGRLAIIIAYLEEQIIDLGATPMAFDSIGRRAEERSRKRKPPKTKATEPEPEPVIKERKKVKRCAVCGAIMEGFRQDATVCGDACRMIAYRKRKRAKRSG
jgi:predicted nucleic acid-binding Zn ribbon protein